MKLRILVVVVVVVVVVVGSKRELAVRGNGRGRRGTWI